MNSKLRMVIGVLAVGFLLAGAGCMETVEEGHQGVQKKWGGATGDQVDPGMQIHFQPGYDYYEYDTREQIYVMSAQAGEGQNANRDDSIEVIADDEMTVNVDAAVVWQIERDKVVDVYQNIGPMEKAENRVRSKARECIRQSGSQFEGLEMTESESRMVIKQDTMDCMENLDEAGIDVLEVQIRNIEPPQRVIDAIEDKEAAQREVERKQAEIEKEELEAERKRIEAQGIRDSQEIIDETLSEEYLQYYWIEEGLEKGDTVYVVPSDGGGQPVMTKDIDSAINASSDGE